MVVQVTHQSVNDFMITRGLSLLLALNVGELGTEVTSRPLSSSLIAVQMSHAVMYLSCLSYLSNELPDSSLEGVRPDLRSKMVANKFPFLRYSASYSLTHAEQCGDYRGLDLDNETRLLTQSIPVLEFARRVFKLRSSDRSQITTGTTLLHLASAANLKDLVKYRIQNGDNLEARTASKSTPMYMAATQGRLAVMRILSENGADIYWPLFLAASGDDTEIFNVLLTYGGHFDHKSTEAKVILDAAVRHGNVAICRRCLDIGIDVNTQTGRYGNALQTAVVMAPRRGTAIVSLFIEAGANVNAQGGEHSNAFYAATYSGDEKVVCLLLEAGADVSAQGGRYGNALCAAVYYGRIQIVRLLLKAGADVNAQGGEYSNALQAAVSGRNRNVEVVRILLEAGADVNAQGGIYGNALQVAVVMTSHSGTEIVRLLIEAGANVNAQGGQYGNALDAARHVGSMEAMRILCEAGADVNA